MEQLCQQYGPGIGPIDQLNDEQRRLVTSLHYFRETRQRHATLAGAVYSCAQDFVLRHGVWYRPGWFDGQWGRGTPKMCFGNSIARGYLMGFHYIEGFSIHPKVGFAIHHAWNMTPDEMCDSTWLNLGTAYLGVRFSVGRADDCSWEGDATVLDDHRRGHPLFQQPWTGEDFGRVWPKSEITRMIERRGKALLKPSEEAYNANA